MTEQEILKELKAARASGYQAKIDRLEDALSELHDARIYDAELAEFEADQYG